MFRENENEIVWRKNIQARRLFACFIVTRELTLYAYTENKTKENIREISDAFLWLLLLRDDADIIDNSNDKRNEL